MITTGCATSAKEPDQSNEVSDVAFVSTFDYQPEAPKGGKLLGIIELGYSGFNSFIVTMDRRDRWTLEKAIYDDSYVDDGEVTLDHIQYKIEFFKTQMLAFGVNKNNINFVASSSAIKNPKVQRIMAKLREMGVGIISVTPDQEANFAFLATVPKSFRENAYMIDLGTGSTKISWFENDKVQTLETIGSKYYQTNIPDSVAYKQMNSVIDLVPEQNKNICFIVGRIPYVLATATNSKSGRYTVLEPPHTYQLRGGNENAGINLYKAIYNESTIAHVFDWDSNFSIGVLMSVN